MSQGWSRSSSSSGKPEAGEAAAVALAKKSLEGQGRRLSRTGREEGQQDQDRSGHDQNIKK